MCLLNVPYRPFPRVLSSPSAPSSKPSASTSSTVPYNLPRHITVISSALRGIREFLLDPVFFTIFQGKETQLLQTALPEHEFVCFQELHGKDELLQAVQVVASRFRPHGTFIPKNVNAGGPAICIQKDFLLDDALVTHIVNIRSRCRNPVIGNVHFQKYMLPPKA